MQKSSFYNSNTHKITDMKQHICVEKWKKCPHFLETNLNERRKSGHFI